MSVLLCDWVAEVEVGVRVSWNWFRSVRVVVRRVANWVAIFVVCRGTMPLAMAGVVVRLCWRGVEEDWFVWETFFFDRGALRALRGGVLGL